VKRGEKRKRKTFYVSIKQSSENSSEFDPEEIELRKVGM